MLLWSTQTGLIYRSIHVGLWLVLLICPGLLDLSAKLFHIPETIPAMTSSQFSSHFHCPEHFLYDSSSEILGHAKLCSITRLTSSLHNAFEPVLFNLLNWRWWFLEICLLSHSDIILCIYSKALSLFTNAQATHPLKFWVCKHILDKSWSRWPNNCSYCIRREISEQISEHWVKLQTERGNVTYLLIHLFPNKHTAF